MKKLVSLILAAMMLLGLVGTASADDVPTFNVLKL